MAIKTAPGTAAAATLPLLQRPIDAVWVFWYFCFWFSVMFTDLHNFMAAATGVTIVELESTLAAKPGRIWPPPVLTHLYYRWARTVDPLLYENPVWWQVRRARQARPRAARRAERGARPVSLTVAPGSPDPCSASSG